MYRDANIAPLLNRSQVGDGAAREQPLTLNGSELRKIAFAELRRRGLANTWGRPRWSTKPMPVWRCITPAPSMFASISIGGRHRRYAMRRSTARALLEEAIALRSAKMGATHPLTGEVQARLVAT